MFCIKCGNDMGDSAKFCAKCGTPAGGNTTGTVLPNVEKDINKIDVEYMGWYIAAWAGLLILTFMIFGMDLYVWIPGHSGGTKITDYVGQFFREMKWMFEALGQDGYTLGYVMYIVLALATIVFLIGLVAAVQGLISGRRSSIVENCKAFSVTLIILCVVAYLFGHIVGGYFDEDMNSSFLIIVIGVLAGAYGFGVIEKFNNVAYYKKKNKDIVDVKNNNSSETIKYGGSSSGRAKSGWTCSYCGKINEDYTGTCSCGKSKYN